MASYEPQSTSSPPNKAPINLLRGWPNPSLLPTNLIRSAADTILSDPSTSTPGLLYGPDPGYQPLRESIARWLNSFYTPHSNENESSREREGVSSGITADRICIAGGASQNLGCVLSVYTEPKYTRCVWIVAPAYFLAFRIFEDAGLEMRAVPEDEEGVDIAFLRREMEKAENEGECEQWERQDGKRPWAKVYKHIIYCVPTFANPSSETMTLDRRKDLVGLAREFDALVVCDDVYDFLQWPASATAIADPNASHHLQKAHLPRLVDVDRTIPHAVPPKDEFGNVCSNGSFSKLAGPGLRCGWCEGTPTFAYGISQAGTTKSGGAPSQLTSTYLNVLLENGQLQDHIRDVLIPAYGRRYAKLLSAIEKELVPLGFGLPTSNAAMRDVRGGYFAWLALPSVLAHSHSARGPSAAESLSARCLSEENVTIAPGKIFEVPGNEHKIEFGNCIRLCWAWEDEEKLEEGVRRIGRVSRAMIGERKREKDGALGGGWVLVKQPGQGVQEGKEE